MCENREAAASHVGWLQQPYMAAWHDTVTYSCQGHKVCVKIDSGFRWHYAPAIWPSTATSPVHDVKAGLQ